MIEKTVMPKKNVGVLPKRIGVSPERWEYLNGEAKAQENFDKIKLMLSWEGSLPTFMEARDFTEYLIANSSILSGKTEDFKRGYTNRMDCEINSYYNLLGLNSNKK